MIEDELWIVLGIIVLIIVIVLIYIAFSEAGEEFWDAIIKMGEDFKKWFGSR
jgi:uncharacterized membrane protein